MVSALVPALGHLDPTGQLRMVLTAKHPPHGGLPPNSFLLRPAQPLSLPRPGHTALRSSLWGPCAACFSTSPSHTAQPFLKIQLGCCLLQEVSLASSLLPKTWGGALLLCLEPSGYFSVPSWHLTQSLDAGVAAAIVGYFLYIREHVGTHT